MLHELYLELSTKMPVGRWAKNMNKATVEEIQRPIRHVEDAHSLLLINKRTVN